MLPLFKDEEDDQDRRAVVVAGEYKRSRHRRRFWGSREGRPPERGSGERPEKDGQRRRKR